MAGHGIFDRDLIEASSNDVTGTFSATLAGATMSAVGAQTFSGTLAASTADATMSASGVSGFTGAFAATAAGDTMSAAGAETFTGTLSATAGPATAAISGQETFTGQLAAQSGPATAAMSGTESMSGPLAATTAMDAADFDGQVLAPVTGTMSSTLEGASMQATGSAGGEQPRVTGSMWWKHLHDKKREKTKRPKRPKAVRGNLRAVLDGAGIDGRGAVDNTRRGPLAASVADAGAVAIGRVKEGRAAVRAVRALKPTAEPVASFEDQFRAQRAHVREYEAYLSATDIEASDTHDLADLELIGSLK